jgi:hypothetical protein
MGKRHLSRMAFTQEEMSKVNLNRSQIMSEVRPYVNIQFSLAIQVCIFLMLRILQTCYCLCFLSVCCVIEEDNIV